MAQQSGATEFRSISGHYLFRIVCLVFPTYVLAGAPCCYLALRVLFGDFSFPFFLFLPFFFFSSFSTGPGLPAPRRSQPPPVPRLFLSFVAFSPRAKGHHSSTINPADNESALSSRRARTATRLGNRCSCPGPRINAIRRPISARIRWQILNFGWKRRPARYIRDHPYPSGASSRVTIRLRR